MRFTICLALGSVALALVAKPIPPQAVVDAVEAVDALAGSPRSSGRTELQPIPHLFARSTQELDHETKGGLESRVNIDDMPNYIAVPTQPDPDPVSAHGVWMAFRMQKVDIDGGSGKTYTVYVCTGIDFSNMSKEKDTPGAFAAAGKYTATITIGLQGGVWK
ncbi:hypothetical protein UVI_02053260 [Ustilaginoidea virens]|uniref:Uncharacterized protein n=1 Tax=Ustilaginoidea virens TaxID=1159556 RepID=A0A1B5L838_USTVR|nr:hypothetical protein UVI_02053260 [Ustilaginoidea virens]